MLQRAVEAFAAGLPPVSGPRLRLARISRFWALTPCAPCPPLDRLANTCVRALDRFRAPPPAAELARRRAAGLTWRQEVLLQHWGYPYVMDEFRFHMTLTMQLDDDEGARVGHMLGPLVEPLCGAPLAVAAVSLVRQEDRKSSFRLVGRYPLSG
jgi:hypothetical protein